MVNPWVELLLEVEEMRIHQKAYFKKKDKLDMAKSKLCEMKVDQMVLKVKVICKEKGIELTKEDES